MRKARKRTAFTLIELLVVVAIIALLISILLPSLSGAREQGKRGVCLSNLKQIGIGTQTYASEDSREQLIPIQQYMVKSTAPANSSLWMYRHVNWHAWGGKTPNEPYNHTASPNPATGLQWLTDSRLRGYWSITRPMNRLLYPTNPGADNSSGATNEIARQEQFKLFQCPSDTGYPDSPLVDDSSAGNANRPCYDTLGNSYRGSLFCYLGADGAFAIGPWGHRASTLRDTGRQVLIGEPLFFNMIGLDNGSTNPAAIDLFGWHKRKLTDNLLYCDGSARSTLASGHRQLDGATASSMGITNATNQQLISRGPNGWQMDCWPIPGARIWGAGVWAPPYNIAGSNQQWPFLGAQNNLTP